MPNAVLAAMLAAFAVLVLEAQTPARGHRGPPEHELLAKAVLEELVEIDTTQSGSTTPAAEAVAARLRAAGFPDADVQRAGPAPNRGNLVARLRGRTPGASRSS